MLGRAGLGSIDSIGSLVQIERFHNEAWSELERSHRRPSRIRNRPLRRLGPNRNDALGRLPQTENDAVGVLESKLNRYAVEYASFLMDGRLFYARMASGIFSDRQGLGY